MAAFYSGVGFDAEGAPLGDVPAVDSVRERLAARTTAELEGRLADLFERLVMARSALLLTASVCCSRVYRGFYPQYPKCPNPQSLAAHTTAELEGRLADLFERLVMARSAVLLTASVRGA